MGAALRKPRGVRARSTVENKYTKPCGLYVHRGIDTSRLKKLILAGKLAPCFPGVDSEDAAEGSTLEECPICMLCYPSLNRSKCCNKGLCTECFLQVKSPCAAPVACPFCKDVGYAVVFRGKKTPEEWQRELLEDQRVLEARLRNRSSSDGAEPMAPASAAGDQELPGGPSSPDPPPSSSSSSPLSALPTVQGSFRNSPAASPAADDDTRRAAFLAASPPSAAAGIAAMQQARLARLADFMSPAMLSRAMRGGGSMDLEDVMLMEGILASLQDAQPAALDAADGSASDSGSAESDCESPAAEGDVSSSAVAVPRAAGPPRRLARAASSVPQESAMGVARGALARRPSLDAAGIAPSLHAQLQFWGMHATPAAAAAAEAEMVAAAVRESLAAVPPVQPPAAEPPVAEPPAGELPADAEPAGAPAAAAEPPMVAEAAAEGAALSLQPSS